MICFSGQAHQRHNIIPEVPHASLHQPIHSFQESGFYWNEEITNTYHKIIDLKLNAAAVQLTQLKSLQPSNLAIHFLEDYIDFFKLYISEEKDLLDQTKDNEEVRLNKIEETGDPNSPYTKYALAEINLHWGLIYLKFGSYLPSFQRIRRAYKLLEENQKLFPDFIPNLKSLGIIHAMLSTIPDELKWIVKALGGMSGTISQGRQELKQVFDYAKTHHFLFTEETTVMYGLVMAYFDNDIDAAWNLINSSTINPEQSPLACFVRANLAMKKGYNDQAIQILSNKPEGEEYFQVYFLEYMLGLAKLHKLDKDANQHLKNFVTHFKGRHYLKECYQKLAWYELINNNTTGYQSYMNLVQQSGEAEVDEDKQAQLASNQKIIPNPTLLQIRLLFDGSYLHRAQSMMESHYTELINKPELKLEAAYRSARIYHGLENYSQAITNYLQVIEWGKKNPEYFACSAALYTGRIYETLQHKNLAIRYYEQCLAISPSSYRSSLHQKAKAGINRMNKK